MSRRSRCKLVYGYAVPVLHRSYYAVNRYYSKIENNELETIQRRSFPFSSEESEVEVDVKLIKRCYNIANVSLIVRSCMTGWQHRDGLERVHWYCVRDKG